ncbi:uncharacterized protein LOC115822752 [Chanos chanos]|uniref:Uncharacterized protein LOC115822752 n=1 Tax=Chanos chanos TaxID=29144 RepID=A0A6J2WGP5_CHACN|nr:uncharacterized protein LOC115822752 [Chanos chanos]
MGAVIEKAVNVAVETVLAEMIRVVSLKFEEFRREMTAKEKENQNIRQMLEISRSQMKTMRKYVNVLCAKDSRPVLTNPRHSLPQSDVLRTQEIHVDGSPVSQRLKPRREAHSTTFSGGNVAFPKPRNPDPTADIDRIIWERQRLHLSKPHDVVQGPVRTEGQSSTDIHPVEMNEAIVNLAPTKDEDADSPLEQSGCQLSEACESVWCGMHLESFENQNIETQDSNTHSLVSRFEGKDADNSTSTEVALPLEVKEEESEIEIVCVKTEPTETSTPSTSECPGLALDQLATASTSRGSLSTTETHQAPSNTVVHTDTTISSMGTSTYVDPQLSVAGVQRPMRIWRKDLNLYEEYKRQRAELRRRSQNRQRELEQSLPQALLADLVRERREKTRLRVARWRAKRKLQACLMTSQPAQLNGQPAPIVHAQRGFARAQRRGRTPGPYGTSVQSHPGTEAYNPPVQLGSNPSVQTHTHNIGIGLTSPGTAPFLQ